MEREEPNDKNEYRCKSTVKPEELHLKAKRITAVEFDGTQENIRLKIRDDTEDNTKGVNGNKMDTNITKKRDQESNNTGFGKVDNNKHASTEDE
jgi:hypothetical protein